LSTAPTSEPAESAKTPGLGTFLGVYTPTILTILGVIMYLRFGWVIGNAGIWATLIIVALANAITFATALSLSSVATNMKVGVGGAYFIISRSLGLEIGGAIGLPLFLSQAVSLTLYCFGLAESLRLIWPGVPVPLVAAGMVILVAGIAARSTVFALKMQIPILGLVALSLLSLLLGADWNLSAAMEMPASFIDADFWKIFAVFFPAVTGILAGVSLSGDLAEPDRAIPIGTLTAVITGALIYMAIPFALASSVPAEMLRDDSMVWMKVALVPALILPGLWGAILSSAIGSILGAPRTLQAMADDGLVSPVIGKLGADGEPRMALYLSAAVALLACALGDLNTVAVTVSMFFLTTYGMVNIVCGLEGLIGDPSFRPRFRFHWSMSLACAVACVWVMFLIHPIAAALAISIEVAIFAVMKRRALKASWGDLRGGLLMQLAIWALVKKRHKEEQARSWRPHILVFTSDPLRNLALVEFTWALSLQRGVLTITSLVVGDFDAHDSYDQRARSWEEGLQRRGISAFCEVHVVPELESGMVTVAQANGMAGLASNTVLLGWPDKDQLALPVIRVMRRLDKLGKSLLIVRHKPAVLEPKPRIVVWWTGARNNGDLMLMLAHMLSLNPGWRGSRIELKSVVFDAADQQPQSEALAALSADVRIEVHPQVVLLAGRKLAQVFAEHSRGAGIVFMGMGIPEPGEEEAYRSRVEDLVKDLPTTVLVRNASPFRGQLLQTQKES
jgi:potassium/chloride transporter 4/5/6